MGIWYFVAKRALLSAGVVISVAIIAFMLVHLAPGDPAQLLAGEAASPDYVKLIRAEYGLDRPLPEQLATYLGNLARGNLGYSLTFSQPVLDVILGRIPQTLLLVGTAIFISITVGILLGLASARRPFSATDAVINSTTLTLYSIPTFWLGEVLILAFALQIRLFPTGGLFDVGVETNTFDLMANVAWHMVLPVLTLSALFLASYARLTRAGLFESLRMNYIVQARAKGVSEKDILNRHALRNALLPVITVAGIQIGYAVGGVVLTENVFSWPGIGTLLVLAVSYRDYPLVTGIFLISAISVAVANLIADMIYGIVDPRIKTEGFS